MAGRKKLIGKVGGSMAGLAGVTAVNPVLGTALGVTAGTIGSAKAVRSGVRRFANHGTGPISGFAAKRPLTTTAIGGLALGGLYSGGPGSGSRVSKRNQNNYYVRRMRSGQSSGVAGIQPGSLGGFA